MIATPRLLLRTWRDSDREPFAAMNADSEVMEFFASTLTREQSSETVDRIMAHQRAHGFCFFAAELPGQAEFIGFIGISTVPFEAAFTPDVEIGWRLARPYWYRGLATEGARACLRYGFDTAGCQEIVAYTAVDNVRSRRVMEKIGMRHDEHADFDHPRVPVDCPVCRQVLYRVSGSRTGS